MCIQSGVMSKMALKMCKRLQTVSAYRRTSIMSRRINDVGPDFTAETDAEASLFFTSGSARDAQFIHQHSSNNPKNPRISSRMDVSRLGGDHLAECDDKETRREK